MPPSKKTKKSKPEKISERLGELEGSRRPFLAAFILVVSAYLIAAMIGFAPNQKIFFRDGILKDFVHSSAVSSDNVCGAVGATFCVVALSIFGAGAFLLLGWLAYCGVLCLLKKARVLGIFQAVSMLLSAALFSTGAALFHKICDEAMTSSPYFTSGWGGKLGSFLYSELFHPWFNYAGSLIVVSILYGFFFVAALSESPRAVSRAVFSVFVSVPAAVFKFVASAYREMERRREARRQKREGSESDVDIKIVRAEPEKPAAKKEAAPEIPPEPEDSFEGSDGEEDFADGLGDSENFGENADASPDSEDFGGGLGDGLEAVGPANLDEVLGLSQRPSAKAAADALKELDGLGESAGGEDFSAPSKPSSGLKISVLKTEKYTPPKKEKKRGGYVFPTVDLLPEAKRGADYPEENYEEKMEIIISKIRTFKIGVKPAEVFPGPVITRYEVRPDTGVRSNKILNLEDDLALALAVPHVRVSLTGRGTIGIEVPNAVRQNVCLREIIESKEWNESKAKIPVVMGKDVSGKPVVLDLAKMPHALVAGSTGSGKSVCINTVIASLLYRCTPEDLRFIMVDPKVVELQGYNSLPHMLVPVVTEPKKVPAALTWLVNEMMKRYEIFKETGVKNIAGFNAKILKDKEAAGDAEELDKELTPEERALALESTEEGAGAAVEIPKTKMPYIVCIIDELADLMMVAGKEVEMLIARLTQLARAAGIHLIVATQRPSTDVVTGLIKSNLPTRIAFKAASYVDSRTILDAKGAETLIGNGDMLFIPPGSSDLIRAQGAYVSDEEIERIVEAVAQNGEPQFDESIQQELESAGDDFAGADGDWDDPDTPKAWKIIKESGKASGSFIQRKLRIGYNKAARIMEELEEKGYVSADNGLGKREILK